MNYDLSTLEFDKVLAKLDKHIKIEYTKQLVLDYKFNKSYDEILKSNNETKEAYEDIVKLSDLPIENLGDALRGIKRSKVQGILNEKELLDIVSLLDVSDNIIKYFKKLDSMKVANEFLKYYSDNLTLLPVLKTNITLAIDKDGRVVDNASRELFMVRRSLKSLENRLRSKLNELLTTRASMLTEPLIVQRDGRMCLPVKIEHKNTFKGIVHDVSSSNTTAYIEPAETLEIANQIDSYLAQEKKEVEVVLKGLSLLVASDADTLSTNYDMICYLDLIFAKALMGKENGYNLATIENKQAFNLKNAKHPLIDPTVCVPITVDLGNKYNVIIITGPNTGGKTVAIKTVGLLHLMVYFGMMVPAHEDSSFGYFEQIYADIGDEQSIEQSLSTFSSHMSKIVKIVDNITDKSLVLLDELGSGTDPKEGSSLAISIIGYLKSNNVKVISTTHYSELKNYAYNTPGIINASVEFNTEDYRPTYKLLLGIPGKSNAIEIASKIGLNMSIVDDARAHLTNTNSESSNLIGNLEEEMTKLRKNEEELLKKQADYEKLVNDLKLEKLALVKQTDKIISDARKNGEKIIAEAKEEAEKLITEIRNLSDENFKEHQLAELKKKTRELEIKKQEETLFADELHEGDFVYVKSYQKYGTIAKIKKDKYVVNIGQFGIEFNRSELQLAAKPEPKKKKETKLSGYNPASHARSSLDLRGKRYEEVTYLMDQYFDQAILGNLECVTIIHGFGTGTIREAVQAYLKKCSFVKSFRYGREGEGLNGVTVVYLK